MNSPTGNGMPTSSSTKPTIFFVDDEIDLLDIYAERFERHFNVKCFEAPALLFKALEEGVAPPNIIITDYRMGDMNGVEMIAKLNQMGLIIPAILLTGNPDSQTKQVAAPTSIKCILEKPCKDADLKKSIAELLA
jgi:DNA-binding NtrC family response regulator